MKKINDYQWPSFLNKPKIKFNFSLKEKNGIKLIKQIESFFEKEYGYKTILFPSARSGIASILRFYKLDRSNEVFINKWVSHCIFNTVGRYTNISTSFVRPDLVIAVHKWGIEQKIKNKKKLKIIEDSVDSIILNKKNMFINDSEFEFISLPKIIGSISGGLVITKHSPYINFAKKEQNKNKKLGIYQSQMKFDDINKKRSFNTWLFYESINTYTEYNSLLDIKKNLKNFFLNKKLIIFRRSYVKKNFKNINYNQNRLGPIIPIKVKYIKNNNLMEKYFLKRNIHKNKYEIKKFEEVYLLPVHFRISEKKFKFFVNILNKSINKKYLIRK